MKLEVEEAGYKKNKKKKKKPNKCEEKMQNGQHRAAEGKRLGKVLSLLKNPNVAHGVLPTEQLGCSDLEFGGEYNPCVCCHSSEP